MLGIIFVIVLLVIAFKSGEKENQKKLADKKLLEEFDMMQQALLKLIEERNYIKK